MSQYTTGEIAKLCGVTVRTVQYYDSRDLLVPSALSEGGRRLYSEDDVRRLKIICFLRELDLSLNDISRLLSEADPGGIIDLLLDQREKELRGQLEDGKARLQKLELLRRECQATEDFSVESIGDIACIMEGKRNLRRLRMLLLAVGIPLDIAQIAAVVVWVRQGLWWPFVLWLVVDLLLGGAVALYYTKRVAYICPRCHCTFRPTLRENIFARHTPRARRLTCPECGQLGFCAEVYGGKENA